MHHWNFEVWHWTGRWVRGTVGASNARVAVYRALDQVPEYIKHLPKKGFKVTVNVTRID